MGRGEHGRWRVSEGSRGEVLAQPRAVWDGLGLTPSGPAQPSVLPPDAEGWSSRAPCPQCRGG